MDRIRGVILDVDGTLVDSNDAHALAWVEACAEMGYDVRYVDTRRLIGMGGDRLVYHLVGLGPRDKKSKKLRDRKSELFEQKHLTTVTPFPGARDLVERMREEEIVRVVASSARPNELKELLAIANVDDIVDGIVSADDVDATKPAGDPVEEALKLAGIPAKACVVLGDTPYDVEAARRAGVRAVALRCGGWSDGDLRGALAIYDDPDDLLASWEMSPFAQRVSGPEISPLSG